MVQTLKTIELRIAQHKEELARRETLTPEERDAEDVYWAKIRARMKKAGAWIATNSLNKRLGLPLLPVDPDLATEEPMPPTLAEPRS